jgi:hypothetical protein
VSVTLSADDPTEVTWYSVDNMACTPGRPDFRLRSTNDDLGQPFTISTEGRHTLFFFSEDAAGDVEALQTR